MRKQLQAKREKRCKKAECEERRLIEKKKIPCMLVHCNLRVSIICCRKRRKSSGTRRGGFLLCIPLWILSATLPHLLSFDAWTNARDFNALVSSRCGYRDIHGCSVDTDMLSDVKMKRNNGNTQEVQLYIRILCLYLS